MSLLCTDMVHKKEEKYDQRETFSILQSYFHFFTHTFQGSTFQTDICNILCIMSGSATCLGLGLDKSSV